MRIKYCYVCGNKLEKLNNYHLVDSCHITQIALCKECVKPVIAAIVKRNKELGGNGVWMV